MTSAQNGREEVVNLKSQSDYLFFIDYSVQRVSLFIFKLLKLTNRRRNKCFQHILHTRFHSSEKLCSSSLTLDLFLQVLILTLLLLCPHSSESLVHHSGIGSVLIDNPAHYLIEDSSFPVEISINNLVIN